MTMFEYLKELCERKGISIHKLEMDLGFSNGSLSKANTIPLKRAALIADYFGITIEQLWNMEYPEDTFDPVSGYPIYADVEDEKDLTEGLDRRELEYATRLYHLYSQAPSEIQAAVETLLKVTKPDS